MEKDQIINQLKQELLLAKEDIAQNSLDYSKLEKHHSSLLVRHSELEEKYKNTCTSFEGLKSSKQHAGQNSGFICRMKKLIAILIGENIVSLKLHTEIENTNHDVIQKNSNLPANDDSTLLSGYA